MGETREDRVFFTLLEQLRGVAALLVVFAHLVTNFLIYYHRTWGPNELLERFTTPPLAEAIELGRLGVVFFFFISGFVITAVATRESAAEFSVKRLLRIYPPLVFTVFVVAAIGLFGVRVVGLFEQPTPGEFGLAISLVNWLLPDQPTSIVAVGWTLVIEMFFYICMLVLRPLLARIPVLVPLALLALAGGSVLLVGSSGASLNYVIAYIGFLPFLVLGQIVYLVRSSLISLYSGAVLTLAAAMVTAVTLAGTAGIIDRDDYHAVGLVGYLIFLIVVLAEGRVRPSVVLGVVGKRSYSLYLLHVPVGFTVLQLISRDPDVPYTIALAAALIATALVTELSYRLVESPSMRLGRWLAARFRRTPRLP